MMSTIRKMQSAGLGKFLLGLLQIILNPWQGWHDAGKDYYNSHNLLVRGLVPFLIVVALSSLAEAVYYMAVGYMEAVIAGIIDFTGYFVSVFICNYLFTSALKKWVFPRRIDANDIMTLVIYSVASMALMTLLNNIFPADLALLSFLPLYVIYILWCARDYMDTPDDRRPHYLAVAMFTVFLPPYILSYCLSLFI